MSNKCEESACVGPFPLGSNAEGGLSVAAAYDQVPESLIVAWGTGLAQTDPLARYGKSKRHLAVLAEPPGRLTFISSTTFLCQLSLLAVLVVAGLSALPLFH